MVENKGELDLVLDAQEENKSPTISDQGKNMKMSLLYAILFDCLLIFSCISFICLFYAIGGVFLNPLLIFGTLMVILLFAMAETLSLVGKLSSKNKKVTENSRA